MYEIIGKIYQGNNLVKYEVKDISTSQISILSQEMVQGLAMADALVNAKYNVKTQGLEGKVGYDLRKLPRKQEKKPKINSLNWILGDNLRKFVEEQTRTIRHERYILKDLMTFLGKNPRGKVCILYGLRRTGKTILMYQAIKRLDLNKVAYITLTEQDSLYELYQSLDIFVRKGYKYIFIDEITEIDGFLQSSARLADEYAKKGLYIIVTGTNSFLLNLSHKNNLYDRAVLLNTTYIGYKEFCFLTENNNILDYLRFGGVLLTNSFYDVRKTNDYINTAIIDNIIKSLISANNRKQYQRLLELNERGLLRKAIEQAIESANEELTLSVITHSYKNCELGSVKQLMSSVFNIDNSLDIEEIEDRVRYKLGIVKYCDAELNNSYLEELKEFLEELGIIKYYKRYVGTSKLLKTIDVPLFVQPGLRYHQTIALVNALCESKSFYTIIKKQRDLFLRKIIEDVEGNLLEHEVILSFLKKYETNHEVEITQLTYNTKEIDLIVKTEDKVYLFEIKRSSKIVENQAKWLVNKEICDYIEENMYSQKIDKRIVLYLGKDSKVMINGVEVFYKNIETFLKTI